MIDMAREIEAIQRSVGTSPLGTGEGRAVRIQRTFDSPIEDVWDAVTTPERISRWFLPISGDYRVGGSFQFEGNAGGRIVACERPNRLFVTWGFVEMGDAAISELELRLTPEGNDATVLELLHTAIVPSDAWDLFGPGAVGVGWEQGLLGLGLHLGGGSVGDPTAWQLSDEGRSFATRSSEAWGAASAAAGADAETVARNVASTNGFYAPEPDASA